VRVIRSIALAGAAVAALALGAGAAFADPPAADNPPPPQSVVAGGSDTITALFDQFQTDYDATSPTWPLYSWDATGSSTIVSKNDPSNTTTPPCEMNRPNGSSSGITQLNDDQDFTYDSTTYQCLDLARTSRNLGSSDPAGLVQIPFARDLISYSYVSGGNAVANLTFTDLQAIYNCNAGLISSSDPDAPVTWNEVGGTSTDAIVPVLPQNGSGTRSSWLTDLGITTVPSCVVNGTSTVDGSVIEENEGTDSEFTSANPSVDDVLFPFSGADYVAEVYTGFDTTQSPGSLVLGDIQGDAPLTVNSSGDTVINISGFYAKFDRTVNVVAKSTGTSPYVPSYLQALVGAGNNSGWICKNATAKTDIANYGFATDPTCGIAIVNY
jgi:ABC-type phosphate transport system substrate-binding protein